MQEEQNLPRENSAIIVPHNFAAEEIGEKAGELTSQQGFSGSTLSVGSTAVYLEGSGDEIFWLTNRSVFFHRRSIRGSFSFNGLTSGQLFLIEEGILSIGSHIRIDLSPANERLLVGPDPRNVAPWTATKQRILQFRETLEQVDGAKGLGVLFPIKPTSPPNHESSSILDDKFIKQSREIIRQIAIACTRGRMEEIVRHSQHLIGFGPGLTPSGDDSIGGMFFVFQWLKEAYPRKFNWGSIAKEQVSADARAGTNKISFTILSDLIQGHGPKPLHSLLSGLFHGEPDSELLEDTKSLVRIGHSSGWDMLAGVATGLLIAESAAEGQ